MNINKSLETYLKKRYGCEFEVVSVNELNAKDTEVVLDFGDDEIIEVLVRSRKGENGNYRIIMEGCL